MRQFGPYVFLVVLLCTCHRLVWSHRVQTRFTGEMRFKGERDYVDSRGGKGPGKSGGVNGKFGGNVGGMGMGGFAAEGAAAPAPGISDIKVDSSDAENPQTFEQLQKESSPKKEAFQKKGKKQKPTVKRERTSRADESGTTSAEEASQGDVPAACPGPCFIPQERQLRYALQQYWLGNTVVAFDCACAVLSHGFGSANMANAIMYALANAKDTKINIGSSNSGSKHVSSILNSDGQAPRGQNVVSGGTVNVRKPADAASSIIPSWEVLGPLPVGKLEVDADPSFGAHTRQRQQYTYTDPDWIGDEGSWSLKSSPLDPIRHIMTLPYNVSVYSELMSQASVQWRTYYASADPPAGSIELRFGASWSDLARGVSSSAALEFQGWARTTTYAHVAGSYGLFCQGVHTAYIINDDQTRLLVGDVYNSGKMVTSVDLRVGPVAIVLPLRGSVGLQFLCQLTEQPIPSSDALMLFPPRDVPHLLRLGNGDDSLRGSTFDPTPKNHGLMVSSVFTLPVHNTQANPLTLAFAAQLSHGVNGRFSIRPAGTFYRSGPSDERKYRGTSAIWNASHAPVFDEMTDEQLTIVGPGQVLLVPLELVELPRTTNSPHSDSKEFPHTFLPCRDDVPFTIIVTPSRGMAQRVEMHMQCRYRNESFLVSYVDHDGSVAQAAVILPLPVQGLLKAEKVEAKTGSKGSRRKKKQHTAIPGGNIQAGSRFVPSTVEELMKHEKLELLQTVRSEVEVKEDTVHAGIVDENSTSGDQGDANSTSPEPNTVKPTAPIVSQHPVLLSLHGTGTGALAQADSYKHVPIRGETRSTFSKSRKRAGSEDSSSNIPVSDAFVFGVEGFWVVAPTRWGAHNWEAIGELSARHSVGAVQRLVARFPSYLPQVWPHDGIIAGHSMGAHGAWLLAINDPDANVCVSSTAGWLSKEHYSTSNAFFHLDVQNSFTQPGLRSILARSLHEFHVDQLASNLQGVDKVHIRVGSGDQTTHPWFSRRMARLLSSVHEHSGTQLEEVPEKQHWWWDTDRINDGGVMNDAVMRSFYRECLMRSQNRQRRRDEFKIKQPVNSSDTNTADECAYEKPLKQGFFTGPNSSSPDVQTSESSQATSSVTRRDHKESERDQVETGLDDIDIPQRQQDLLYEELTSQNACITGNFAVEAVNLAHSRGACGVRILQQQQQLIKSSVKITCSPLRLFSTKTAQNNDGDGNVPRELHEGLENMYGNDKVARNTELHELPSIEILREQRCDIRTSNVLRLLMHFADLPDDNPTSHEGSINSLARWYVDGRPLEIAQPLKYNDSVVELCWPGAGKGKRDNKVTSGAKICSQPIDQSVEKSPALQGPLRMVASRPLLVVYGTPRDSNVRVALRDLAIYITNSHAAAHGTFIRAITDLEYRAGGYALSNGPETHNLILVGGPKHNKVMRALDGDEVDEMDVSFSAAIPVEFKGSKQYQHKQRETETSDSKDSFDMKPADWFRIGPNVFDADTNTVLFAFPLTSDKGKASSSLVVCISSNTAVGYMHASRLAWPTVPPMVRAPFANYLPDFIVVDESVWSKGFGGISIAGFWDSWWQYDESQSFLR